MKKLAAFTILTAFAALTAVAQEAEDPFADTVEIRHGLMLQMSNDLGTMGAMAKGDAAYDAVIAGKAAANIAAIASVLSMAQFPAGSEQGKAGDSYAKAEIWANQDDFLAKIAALNMAAASMQVTAATDLDGLKAGMAGVGGACAACHKAYRAPES